MCWKKGWMFFVPLFILLNPLSLDAKVNLNDMNLLENVEIQSTANELIVKFNFKKRLGHYNQPVFFKKSIQLDFPFAYSQPAKQFLKTGNSKISQIYVSQYNAKKMRVRFILEKGGEGDYKDRFHLQKEGNSLTVRVDRKQGDILDQLLARTTEKIEEKKLQESVNEISTDIKNKKSVESQPIHLPVKKLVLSNASDLKKASSEKIKMASFNKKPNWKSDKKKIENTSSGIKKTSLALLKPDNKQSNQLDLISSGFKMIMTLSLVLGLIFVLFFGFKKYVLKNTVFGGGGKLINILSTNFLAPKKNIALVEVAGEILVLGVSDQSISLLTSIREPKRVEEIKEAHGDNSVAMDWKQENSGNVARKGSLASSNAANVFSKYLKQYSGSESKKQASVEAVTEQIRRNMGKVRTT